MPGGPQTEECVSRSELRVGLNLHQRVFRDERRLDERVRWLDVPEPLAMRPRHRLPVLDPPDEHPRPDDILEASAERLQCALNLVDDEVRLRRGVGAADGPAPVGCGGP